MQAVEVGAQEVQHRPSPTFPREAAGGAARGIAGRGAGIAYVVAAHELHKERLTVALCAVQVGKRNALAHEDLAHTCSVHVAVDAQGVVRHHLNTSAADALSERREGALWLSAAEGKVARTLLLHGGCCQLPHHVAVADDAVAGTHALELVEYVRADEHRHAALAVEPGEKVYEGMVIGYSPAGDDMAVNICKTKHLTNTRASGSDDALRLVPVSKFSLEASLEFLKPDELLEVTPENLRIRKQILKNDLRMKAAKGKK